MSIDAVALLRIPGFTPPEDADVRELEDGFLLFLEVPYESPAEAILDAIDDVVGDGLFDHAETRGIFVFPDAAEPEDAETYDAVIEKVGGEGAFLSLGAEPIGNPEEMLGQMMEALGMGSGGDIMKALQSGDEDALKMAQIQMMSAMERAMAADPRTIDAQGQEASDEAAGVGDAVNGDAVNGDAVNGDAVNGDAAKTGAAKGEKAKP